MRANSYFTFLILGFLSICIPSAIARADTVFRPTYPGTSIPNLMAPGYIEQREGGQLNFRETYPGTSIPNLSKPGLVEEGDGIYPTYPGTSIRDYSKPGFVLDPQ